MLCICQSHFIPIFPFYLEDRMQHQHESFCYRIDPITIYSQANDIVIYKKHWIPKLVYSLLFQAFSFI